MAARIQWRSRRWQSSWTRRLIRQFLSWSIFRALKRREDLGKHSVYTHFLKTEISRSVKRQKLQGPLQKTNWQSRTSCRKFWWVLSTKDDKVLSESCEYRNNHRYAAVVQDLVWTAHLTHEIFSLIRHAHAWRNAQVISLACALRIASVIFIRLCCVFDSPRLFPLQSFCSSSWLSASSSSMRRTNTLRTSSIESTLDEYDPLTSYEPNGCHISETTEPYILESSGENGSLNDLEYDDYTIGRVLFSPLFTQKRENDASRRRACHSLDEGLSSTQSSSVGHRTGRTCWWTWFTSPKRQRKSVSRVCNWANQDSPGTTERSDTHWL